LGGRDVAGRGDAGPTRTAPARRAVTLIELLLVVSLLALLALFTWPDFATATRSERLDESVRRTRSLIAMCRAEAMNNARRYRVTIRLDGSMELRQQFDPVARPQVYVPVAADWARLPFLLEDVWVESVALLADGPAPVLVEDEIEQFEDMERDFEPVPIEDFEQPIHIYFQPDGTCSSLRWVLRDALGRGVQITLDGRVGRVLSEPVDLVPADMLRRPSAVDWEDELDAEREKWEEAGWREPKEDR